MYRLMYRLSIKVTFLSIVTLSVGACSSQSFQVKDGTKEETISTDGKGNLSITARGPDGQKALMTTGESAKYPSDLPLPQYPSSKVTLCLDQSSGPDQYTKTVSLETADAPGKVSGYYKTWFARKNWKVNMESNVTGCASISAESRGQNVSIMTMPAGSSGKTTIQLIVSRDK